MMNRRRFFKTSAALFSAPGIVMRHRNPKVNLLFIWTDEQRRDTLAAYGNHWIQTPHLNRLAAESFVFERGYISQPVCTPSRATVLTGLWPHQHTCTANNVALPDTVACLPELLRDSDYQTGYMGKWHLGDEIFSQHGFQEWISIEDSYRKYYRASRDKSRRSSYWYYLQELGYRPDEANGFYSRNFASRLMIDHCKPKFLESQAIEFLRRHQREPFMLYVNFLEPHMPFYGPLNDLYDPAALPLPHNFHDPLEDNEPLRYRQLRQNYINKGFSGQALKTEQGWRMLQARYYGLVTQVDRSVGAILAELERLQLAEHTIVVFTSDHGDMMASHQLLAKTVMYEESISVPWLMRVPQWGRKQRLVRGRFSHIDLIPTLLELLGQPRPLPGKSLVPVMREELPHQDPVFIQWNGSEGVTPVALADISTEQTERVHRSAIRTVLTQDGWKLCLNEKDKHQLFQLNQDPCETTNVYGEERYQKEITALRKMIEAWQSREKDPQML